MRFIDLDAWARKEHFLFFQTRRNPCVSIVANVDVGKLLEHRNASGNEGLRLSDCVCHALGRAANAIPEFRMRLVDLRPAEFSQVDVAFTYIPEGCSLHSNCIAQYDADFPAFLGNVQRARDAADARPTLSPPGGASQGLIYVTCLPGVAFTSLANPWGDPWVDSVPRFAYGKIDRATASMPVAVEALHSFIDGSHLSGFFSALQEALSDVEVFRRRSDP